MQPVPVRASLCVDTPRTGTSHTHAALVHTSKANTRISCGTHSEAPKDEHRSPCTPYRFLPLPFPPASTAGMRLRSASRWVCKGTSFKKRTSVSGILRAPSSPLMMISYSVRYQTRAVLTTKNDFGGGNNVVVNEA